MSKQIFINLAVKDLQKSMDFYTALGFSNNPHPLQTHNQIQQDFFPCRWTVLMK
jgi:predicted lactoylglutathione lyase